MAKTKLIDLLSQEALPLNTVVLGRLVNRPKEPWQDFCPYSLILPGPGDVSDGVFERLKDTSSLEQSTNITAKLSELLSFVFNRHKSENNKLNTDRALIRRLLNSSEFFNTLCGAEQVRDWLQRSIREKKDVYMVVGLIIVSNAAVNRDSNTALQVGGSLQVPVTALLTGGAAPAAPLPVVAGAADPHIAANVNNKAQSNISFDAPGERIIGVQYRKVESRYHSSGSVTELQTFLKANTRWEHKFGKSRTAGGGGAPAKDDIMEVELEADIQDSEGEDSAAVSSQGHSAG